MFKIKSHEATTFGAIEEYMESVDSIPGERPVMKRRRQRMEQNIVLGRLLPFHISVIEVSDKGGQHLRMDGQRSMLAFYRDRIGLRSAYVTLTIYEGTMDDAKDLYAMFDHTGSARNNADVAGAYIGDDLQFRNADRWLVSALSRGVGFANAGVFWAKRPKKKPSIDVCAAMLMADPSNKRFCAAYIEFATQKSGAGKWLKRLELISAARDLWGRNEQVFYDFFNILLDDNNSGVHCPACQFFRAMHRDRPVKLKEGMVFGAADKCMRAFENGEIVKKVLFVPPNPSSRPIEIGVVSEVDERMKLRA